MKLNIFSSLILESFAATEPPSPITKTKTSFHTFRIYDEEEFRKNHIKALKRLINAFKGK